MARDAVLNPQSDKQYERYGRANVNLGTLRDRVDALEHPDASLRSHNMKCGVRVWVRAKERVQEMGADLDDDEIEELLVESFTKRLEERVENGEGGDA